MTINTYQLSYGTPVEQGETFGFPVQKNVTISFSVSDEDTWHTPMREFLSFLSSIYGYEINVEKYEEK
jgi:hypothetical protein